MEDRVSDLQSELDMLNVKLIRLAWKIDDVDKKIPDESSMEIHDEVVDLKSHMVSFEEKLDYLNNYVNEFDVGFPELPQTNLLSHSLWKRMWAVFGHGLLGNIILSAWIIAIILQLTGGD